MAQKTATKDKFLGYCAVTPSKKFFRLFERAGVHNVLISYHYIRKNLDYVENEILPWVHERGGVFMTDSGAFSFLNDPNFDPQEFDWEEYLDEYVEFLQRNSKHIFSACNLDVDEFVGHDTVKEWNEMHFEPLEDKMNIIYCAHPMKGHALGELGMVKEYCEKYDYVGVNEGSARHASAIYQMAKQTGTAIHGLAWTKPTILKDFPFFSVDSSSWVNYQKYGATPVWDGKNFSQYDKDQKDIRKTLGKQCDRYGVKIKQFVTELEDDGKTHNDDEGLTFSLCTWLDVFDDLKRFAKMKLKFTLGDKLGKDFEFIEPKRSLEDMLESTDARDSREIKVDEDGVALLKKRAEGEIIDLDAFEAEYGDILSCNNCFINDRCPKFKESHSCAFNFSPTSATKSPIATIEFLIRTQTKRVNKAVLIEGFEGGIPNKTYSQELLLLARLNEFRTAMIMKAQQNGIIITERSVTMLQQGGEATQNALGLGAGAQGQLPEGQQAANGGGFASMLKDLMSK